MSFWCRIASRFENYMFRPRLSLWRTAYLNLRVFPWRRAIKFPVLVYGKWDLAMLQGRIEIADGCERMCIGKDFANYFPCSRGKLTILRGGVLRLSSGVKISQGAAITIGRNATLELAEHASIGYQSIVICNCHISIGAHTDLTWQTQVTDFNSHFVETKEGEARSIFRPVEIGDYCWIGNRTSIMPGSSLPNRVIVASNSLLNKDYRTMVQPYSMMAGQPAKVVRTGVARVYEPEREAALMEKFRPSKNHNV